MKILMVSCGMDKGGKERQIVTLIKGLISQEIEVDLVILSKKVSYNDIYNMPIRIHFFEKKVAVDLSVIMSISKLIKANRPDVIHVWDSAAAIHSILPAKIDKIAFINGMIRSTPTRTSFPSKEWFYKVLLMKSPETLVANSKAGLASYGKLNSGKVIYNGYDQARVGSELDHKFVKDKTKIIKIAMIAAFTPKKDYVTFLDAALTILQQRDDVIFYAIGEGPLLNELKIKYNEPRVKFLGVRNDVDNLIPTFDIGVLTCVSSWRGEGIPNALMEFMANSKPVIGTNSGGTKELIQDGINGYIIDENDVDGLIHAIRILISKPIEAREMGCLAAKTIKDKFSVNAMVDRYVTLYRSIT